MANYGNNQGVNYSAIPQLVMPSHFSKGIFYYRVNFIIDTSTYDHEKGWACQSDRTAWEADVHAFLSSFDFESESTGAGYIRIAGFSVLRLYVQPDGIIGYIPKELIDQIHNALDGRQGIFTGSRTDVDDCYEVVCTPEIRARAFYYHNDIVRTLYESLKTSSRSNYIQRPKWSDLVRSFPGLRFGGEYSEHLEEVLHEMVQLQVRFGFIKQLTREGCEYYRAADKSEYRTMVKAGSLGVSINSPSSEPL